MNVRRIGRVAALLLFALALALTIAVLATGGVAWRWGSARVSVRQASHPAIATVVAAIAAWALFRVVPLLGALAVWATYAMGRRLGGPLVGAASSVLLAASPSFLFEVTSPTSDVPVTAWWAATLGLLLIDGPAAALAAGVAA